MNIINRISNRLNNEYRDRYLNPKLVKGKQKIFCVGRNKTGTTSLTMAFEDLGYIVAKQNKAALFLDDYILENFESIIKFCESAQVFQDVPFSLPDTYKYLDQAYPDSKFILTIRDSPEQWHNSVVKFHSKIFGKGRVPTKEDLQNAAYIETGWSWKLFKKIYSTPETDLYNKEILMNHYTDHNNSIISYFGESKNFLVLNVAEKNSYQKFCNFLGVKSEKESFPWLNKTSELNKRNLS